MPIDFSDYANLVMTRRTSMAVDVHRDVPEGVVRQLCALAQWAPNHKRTWPMRFAYLVGDARTHFGEVLAAAMDPSQDETRRQKLRTKYLRTPGILAVGAAPQSDPAIAYEDDLAIAAGIQTLLLGATALGLNTYWSTPPQRVPPELMPFLGFESDARLVAVIYVGWSMRAANGVPERPEPRFVTRTTGS